MNWLNFDGQTLEVTVKSQEHLEEISLNLEQLSKLKVIVSSDPSVPFL